MAIAYDNSVQIASGVSSPASGTLTTSGTNITVVVVVNTVSGSGAPTSITVGGNAATLIDSITSVAGVGDSFLYIAQNVAAGSTNITVTKTGATFWVKAASYTGTATSGQPNAHLASQTSGTSAAPTVTSSSTANCWAVLGSINGHGLTTAGASTTGRILGADGISILDSNGTVATSSTVTLNVSTGASTNWVNFMVTLAPVAGTAWTKTLTETVTNTDSVLKTATKLLTQTITNTDTLIKTATRTLAEAITNAATFLAQIVHASTLSDTITNTDAFLRSITHVLAETISYADTFIKTASRSLLETLTNTASLLKTAGKVLLETITNSDTFTEGLIMASGPNSPAVTANVTTGALSEQGWTNPNNVKVSDGAFATTSFGGGVDCSEYLQVTDFGFSIPLGATINGILVEVQQKGDATVGAHSACTDVAVRIVKGGVIGSTDKSIAGAWSTTLSYVSHGGSSDLWGQSWIPSDINGSGFGFALSVTQFAQPGTGGSVDHIRITVYYVLSGNLYSQTLTDTMTAVDTILKTGTKLLSETITNTDTFIRSTTRTLTEAITSSDTFTKLRTAFSTLTETITNADTLIKLPGKLLSEAISSADNVVRTASRTLSETLTGAATFIRSMTRTLTEAISTADTFLGQIVHASTLTEALTATDTFLRSMAHSFTEAVTNTDTFAGARVLPFTFSEVLTGADSLIRSAGKTLIDGITETASVIRSVGRTLVETIAETDVFAGARSRVATLTEALSSLDSLVRSISRTLSEAITNTDIFAASRVLVRAYSETVTNTATSIRTVGCAIMESVATSATFSRVLTATRTFTETVTLTPLFKALRNGYDVFWVNVSKSATSLVNAAKSGAGTVTNVVKSVANPTNVAKSAAGAITNAARSAASWINQDRS